MEPTTLIEIAMIMDNATYHNKFIPNLAGIAKVISMLTKQGMPFIWFENCHNSLNIIKNRLSKDPVVKNPN